MKPAILGYGDAMNALVKARADLEAKTKVDLPARFWGPINPARETKPKCVPINGVPSILIVGLTD